MKFSENWLREILPNDLNTEQLASMLTMAGLEVEAAEPVAKDFSNVVVAEVLSISKHENADKLNVCTVSVGTQTPLQIVCGARNVTVGAKVPCALVGAELPGDFHIKQAKVRGIESFGMLCSGSELGLDDGVDGLLLLDNSAPVGMDFRKYYQLDDIALTLKLTPNRADCLSLNGVARELAALLGQESPRVVPSQIALSCEDKVGVRVEAGDACPRYVTRVIRNVDAAVATPIWMKQRLERSGIRSLSILVDVTNYVLLEMGQPMHAFDLDKLEGEVVVRFGKEGESIRLLNQKDLNLTSDLLVIADESGPLALAGIMGGEQSAISTDTRNILLESAFFSPQVIQGKSRLLGFGSESSHRFERGVDYANCVLALERASALILEICGGSAGPITDVSAPIHERPSVSVRAARVSKVLGLDFTVVEVSALLSRLGMCCLIENDVVHVTPPSYRFDIEIEEDLIEEVARLHGYDAIPVKPALCRAVMLESPAEARDIDALRTMVALREYQEVINYAFVDQSWEADFGGRTDSLKVVNPIASHMSVMRSTLIGGLVSNLSYNINRKQPRVRLFEISRVFIKEADQLLQPEKLALLAWGGREQEQWGGQDAPVDFFDIKADIEALLAPRKASFVACEHPSLHPGRAAAIILDGTSIGFIGELHPRWVQKYDLNTPPVVAELSLDALRCRSRIRAMAVSKFQQVRRDIAVLVDEVVKVEDMLNSMYQRASAIVTEINVFDLYKGKGIPDNKKSLAFKVILQDTRKTLTDEEVESVMSSLIAELQQRFGATLRA
ncbi:phenylalanine--tRNA ligase subunit beta [Parachitinimonas caeni]|uniref:Phenylalanine--tRNA ligase beta subunit n=1 Tax=Parachitinimonas caeni TaxID=3031301 RepID=A0ABT7DXL9_9NEIS|nr:phenylalanine--tRNA ligase subunit beta [Parachitinimonas caeni]MDK2124819.1 phenylalanine--tRNA ligase subunit beta [Parachitinimonas caeni]